MPLFFFHIRIGNALDEDTVGVDLADLGAVRREAAAAIADAQRDAALTGESVVGEAFEIVDAEGRPVLHVPIDGGPARWSRYIR